MVISGSRCEYELIALTLAPTVPTGLRLRECIKQNIASTLEKETFIVAGAAISDGRLRSGDQIADVNGIDMVGKSQDEVVAILRNMKRGSLVNLGVTRGGVGPMDQTSLPRPLVSKIR